MSLEGAYDPDNIFAKVARGEAPCAKVFEDADTIAFMDLFPQGRGHTLVIHKHARARNLLDAELADIAQIMDTTQRGRSGDRQGAAPGRTDFVMQFNGEASGQTIFHLHFHLIPRWRGTPVGRHAQGMADLKRAGEPRSGYRRSDRILSGVRREPAPRSPGPHWSLLADAREEWLSRRIRRPACHP